MPNFVSSAILRARRTVRTREAQCPNCNQPIFCDEDTAVFDSHGFESYRLICWFCQTSFDGIVDPFDEALLLSARGGRADRLRHSA
jgi:hypothetical protein